MKSIYDLELHETLGTDNEEVLRVSGGWDFKLQAYANKVFVPYNSEFDKSIPEPTDIPDKEF